MFISQINLSAQYFIIKFKKRQSLNKYYAEMACATAIVVFADINIEVEKHIQALILLLARSIFKSFITDKTSDSGSAVIRFIVELTLDLRMIRGRNKKRITKRNKIIRSVVLDMNYLSDISPCR